MEGRYKAYPEYKLTGLEFIHRIPTHWNISKVRYISRFSRGLNITKSDLEDTGIPCVNYGEVHSKLSFEVTPHKNDLMNVNKSYLKLSTSSLVFKGDFIFADTSEDIEGCGNFTQLITDETLFAGYHTFIIRPHKNNHNRFLAYLFESNEFRAYIRNSVKGVKVFSITQAILKNANILLPSLLEQQKIANFLDYETAKIDKLIAKKERLIELLKEKRQAVISHAVTKGLNPNVKMKDSGVKWLGEVPEHWVIVPTKRLFRLVTEPSPQNHSMELLSVYTAIGVAPRKELEQKGNKASDINGYWMVKKGDIIINKLLAWMGAVGYSDYDGVTSPAYDILRKINHINSKFYHYLFRQEFTQNEFKRWSRGIMDMRLRLYFEELGKIMMPLPPKIEQDKIVSQIEFMISKYDVIEEKVKFQIELLKERKSSLISAAVTGKIDVR